ncbi:MAG: hypothetical protein AAF677_11495 [Pseudomonadota bacterium]
MEQRQPRLATAVSDQFALAAALYDIDPARLSRWRDAVAAGPEAGTVLHRGDRCTLLDLQADDYVITVALLTALGQAHLLALRGAGQPAAEISARALAAADRIERALAHAPGNATSPATTGAPTGAPITAPDGATKRAPHGATTGAPAAGAATEG